MNHIQRQVIIFKKIHYKHPLIFRMMSLIDEGLTHTNYRWFQWEYRSLLWRFHKSLDDVILNWNTHVFWMDHMFSMIFMSGNRGGQSPRQIFLFLRYNIVDSGAWHGAPSCIKTGSSAYISWRPSFNTAWYAVESNRVGHLMRILLPWPFLAPHIKMNLLQNRIFFIIYRVRKKYISSPVCQKTRWA